MSTRIEIIDAALVSIGARALQTEAARGAAARISEYQTLRKGLLAHPWYWCTRTRQLARLDGTAQINWAYRYALPADMLGPPRAVYAASDCRTPYHDYDLRAAATSDRPAELVTSAEEVWLRYTVDVAPQFWPGYFELAFTRALAAQFALSVREDTALADRLKRETWGTPEQAGRGGLVGQAMDMDAQATPSLSLSLGANPLVDARY